MIWRLMPLLGFIVLAGVLFAGIQLSRERAPGGALQSVLIGKPAPEFTLPGLRDGESPVGTRQFLGRPWLLNVWASWCAGCRIEHPVIEALARRDGIVVVGLNWKDERGDALRWLAQFGDPYHAIATDPDGRVVIQYGVTGAPETFVIDARGIIRHKFLGPVSDQDVRTILLPLLTTLRAEAGS